MRVQFDVYGDDRAALEECATSVLADFGPGVPWSVDFAVEPATEQYSTKVWRATVTATADVLAGARVIASPAIAGAPL